MSAQEGNAKFKAGQYKQALSCYSQAISSNPHKLKDSQDLMQFASDSQPLSSRMFGSIQSLMSPTTPEVQPEQTKEQQIEELYKLYSNRSATLLMLNHPRLALEDAHKCHLLCDGKWVKGYLRIADALTALRKYEEAIVYYSQALELQYDQVMFWKLQYAQIHSHLQYENVRIIQMQVSGSSLNPVQALVLKAAQELQNFIYAICCEVTRKCVLVDVCWSLQDILQQVQGYEVVGCICTHNHFDHVGGYPPDPYNKFGVMVDGVHTLLQQKSSLSAYIHEHDVPGLVELNPAINQAQLIKVYDGYELKVGTSVDIKFVHTAGHTKGSQCLMVNKKVLFTGDVLFIGQCGRTDFPESNPSKMFDALQKLKTLIPKNNEDILVYPGHKYGGEWTTLKKELKTNPVLQVQSFEAFQKLYEN